jgi:TPR repeat protein
MLLSINIYLRIFSLECWDGEPYNRPTVREVITRLKDIMSGKDQSPSREKPVISLSPPDSRHGDLSVLIENFNKMRTNDLEQFDAYTTTSSIYYSMNINEASSHILTSNDEVTNKDLSKNVDEIIKFYLKLLNEGKNSIIRKRHVLEYLENNKITKEEIYNWLLSNQYNSNNIFLLGYFNFIGTIKPKNYELAFYLFMIANAKRKHILALYYIGACYLYGFGILKNEKMAFKCYQMISDENHAIGQTIIGYFYEKGIGVDKDEKMAVDWYTKGDNNGNYLATFDLAQCFRYGIGVNINNEKAFDLYQKAAKFIPMAQYGLGEMYENGDGTVANIDQAINCYTKSFDQGCQKAQVRLKVLLRTRNRRWSDTCYIN